MGRHSNHAEEKSMSKQQKGNQSSGGGATVGGKVGDSLQKQDIDSTGGRQGDQLSNAVGAAVAGADSSKGKIPPPTSKGGASTT
jgi:hypothetical protein